MDWFRWLRRKVEGRTWTHLLNMAWPCIVAQPFLPLSLAHSSRSPSLRWGAQDYASGRYLCLGIKLQVWRCRYGCAFHQPTPSALYTRAVGCMCWERSYSRRAASLPCASNVCQEGSSLQGYKSLGNGCIFDTVACVSACIEWSDHHSTKGPSCCTPSSWGDTRT